MNSDLKYTLILFTIFVLGFSTGMGTCNSYMLLKASTQKPDTTIDYQKEINDAVLGGRIPEDDTVAGTWIYEVRVNSDTGEASDIWHRNIAQ